MRGNETSPEFVLVVDDHPIVRNALTRRLREWTVIAAPNAERACTLATETRPAVAIVDLGIPDDDGFTLISKLSAMNVKVIVYSGNDDRPSVARSIASGARGFIGKARQEEELVLAVRAVISGDHYLPDEYGEIAAAMPPLLSSLSPAELRVLMLIGAGHSSKAIAEMLQRSPRTIETQRAAIMAKLDLQQGELLSFAIRVRNDPTRI